MIKKTKNHVKIGDKVQIISGNQKGKVGTINAIFKKNSLVYIENVPPRLKKLKQSKEVDKKRNSFRNSNSYFKCYDLGY